VLFLRRPSDARVHRLVAAAAERPFSYPEVGATRDGAAPPGYPLNPHRVRLGAGRELFDRARAAIFAWRMYDPPWISVVPAGAPVEPGATVAMLVRHWGFWSLNPCRIVYRLDEPAGHAGAARTAFALGTVAGHSEHGEERFSVEHRAADDSVHFEIHTFARAQHPLVRVGHPFMRALQARFGREACAAMRAAVG
jgi:uncharacterized protein (UPF0548 family)